mmetsp:Transcript_38834/g.94293  ORF Transcript_38834/g.94293 Transcript_38834/m.94293 type:complete len:105 (-) Transcript_38834:2541-2855(-)
MMIQSKRNENLCRWAMRSAHRSPAHSARGGRPLPAPVLANAKNIKRIKDERNVKCKVSDTTLGKKSCYCFQHCQCWGVVDHESQQLQSRLEKKSPIIAERSTQY